MNYLFRCRKCKHEETYSRPINNRNDRTICPVCDDEMERAFSVVNVVYRGSGFYSTDKHVTRVDPIDYDPAVHSKDDL